MQELPLASNTCFMPLGVKTLCGSSKRSLFTPEATSWIFIVMNGTCGAGKNRSPSIRTLVTNVETGSVSTGYSKQSGEVSPAMIVPYLSVANV